jgi:hypothetical protein
MVLGHWLAAQRTWPADPAEAGSGPIPRAGVLSTRTVEVIGADGRRQIVMGTSGEGSRTAPLVLYGSVPAQH